MPRLYDKARDDFQAGLRRMNEAKDDGVIETKILKEEGGEDDDVDPDIAEAKDDYGFDLTAVPEGSRDQAMGFLRDDRTSEAFKLYCDDVGAEWATDSFEEAYMGKFDSEEAYVQSFVDDMGGLSQLGQQTLENYFDWDAYARDVFINDCTFDNGHVFNRNV